MASNYKTAKTELIAIYRLEFYKNKKDWKLCQDVRKEPPPLPSSSKGKSIHLNETYDVEAEVESEQVSPHNKAFLLEEPDDAPDIEPPPDPELVHLPADIPRCPQAWEEPWPGDKDDWPAEQQEWCGAKAEDVPEDIAYADQCDGPCHQQIWPPGTQYEQPVCDQEALEYLSPTELLQLADDWLHSHGYPLGQQEYANYYEQYGLLDDSADFIRGAHAAPHSSEIDLSDSAECGCASGAPWQLAARALPRALRAHTAALRALLAEAALRDQFYSQSSLTPLSLDDFPTRDTDPLRPDCIVSGSHRIAQPTGRGRGRLQQTEKLIGIGMGRPYRL